MKISMNKHKMLKFENVMLIILLLCGMNFQAKFFYFVYAAFFLYCFVKRYVYIDRMLIVYLIFAVIYSIYGYSAGAMEVIRRLAFVCIYIVGYNCAISNKGMYDEKRILGEYWLRNSMIAFGLGAFFHYTLNFLNNLGTTIDRNTIDIWTGEGLSATGQATLVCPMIAIVVSNLIIPKKKRRRVLYIIILLVVLLYNTILAGRTLIIMLLVDIVFCFIIFQCFEKNKNVKIRTWIVLFSIVLLLYVLYHLDAFGIRTIFEQSNLYTRFYAGGNDTGLMDDERLSRKQYYLTHMWNYWFGGLNMNKEVGYAHDLLLDAFDEGGFLVEVPLLIIVISSGIKAINLVRVGRLSVQNKILILSFYLCVFIQFFMEPILAGERWLFAGFCLINGSVNALLNLSKSKMEE